MTNDLNPSDSTHSDSTPDKNKPPTNKPKKLNGLVIFGGLILLIVVISYRPTIPTIHCDEITLASNPEVIMFGTWWCPYCTKARQYLNENKISYCEYDIEKSEDGKRRYDETKATTIPALIIGNYLLQGFSPARIDEALIRTQEKR